MTVIQQGCVHDVRGNCLRCHRSFDNDDLQKWLSRMQPFIPSDGMQKTLRLRELLESTEAQVNHLITEKLKLEEENAVLRAKVEQLKAVIKMNDRNREPFYLSGL